ncbi:hypothetical protein Vadar_031831 [Vaccinium darrowii]|uniref:Uncharacterized protein n=1 Tax=Vaccinium darrowii TaxID=229202 RepID=A0ACB7Y4R7_9ERIC|nr:hypothetical protein Vadar_031831 [Vaccinium darrowii]
MLPEKDGAATIHCTIVSDQGVNLGHNPVDQTFYDDPDLSYSMGNPVKNWDEKRREWLKHHPSFAIGAEDWILVLTGSQAWPCKNPTGDNLLLRLFKNKVDYSRIHGYDMFYNNVFLHPKMVNWWTKMPLLRATMLAHPETEWILWVDSNAVFADIDFKPPLEKYKDHNCGGEKSGVAIGQKDSKAKSPKEAEAVEVSRGVVACLPTPNLTQKT